MEKQGAKNRRGEEDGSMDRISELPQPILHHILCFLPQDDAVRTCVLSKSWCHLGITRPKIEFEQYRIPKNEVKFLFIVDRILQRYQDRNLSIQEFVLKMCPNNPQSVAILEEWIQLVLHRGVKIFNFDFFYVSDFSLPSVIFQAECLEELYLAKCRVLKSIDKVLLKRLRTLSLESVNISEETWNKILSGCPLIEKVVLKWCHKLTTIKLNAVRNLKQFEGCIRETTSVEFNSQTLEIIRIEDYRNWNHHKMNFPHLKSLCLTRVVLPKESFNIFSCNFPCLVELKLFYCEGFKEFQLSSPSIKRLTIEGCNNSIQAYIIDAPNILFFEFSGDSVPSPFSFTTTSNEWKSRINLKCSEQSKKDGFSTWFLKVNELFKALSQSQISVDIVCPYYLRREISKDTYYDSYEPVEVDHLIANEPLLSSYLPIFLSFVFRTCRPRYIIGLYMYMDAKSEKQRDNNRHVEYLCKTLHKERETISELCFWIHDLKEVIIETFDENAKEWHLVQGTCLSECTLPNKISEQKIRIRLKWRES